MEADADADADEDELPLLSIEPPLCVLVICMLFCCCWVTPGGLSMFSLEDGLFSL